MSSKTKKSIVLMQGVFEDTIFELLKKRPVDEVFVLEGRPNLESMKVNSRELLKRNIKPTIIADNMAGFLFYKNMVEEIWLSYQESDNSGAMCQIGGLILGVLGTKHKVPVNLYPAGKKTASLGKQEDLFKFNGVRVAPKGIKGYVPLMEWVPKKYITKIYPSHPII